MKYLNSKFIFGLDFQTKLKIFVNNNAFKVLLFFFMKSIQP